MLFGARRVGKTSLVEAFLAGCPQRWYRGFGEDATLAHLLSSHSLERYRMAFESFEGLFIDEAQEIPGIGKALKLLVDALPGLRIIVTGSYSFRLEQDIGQPLTGRRRVRHLHPISASEIRAWRGPLAVDGLLEDLLVYGAYPEVLQTGNPADRREYLRQLAKDYLFRDILAFEQLRSPKKLGDLLVLLAHQIGKEVSLAELGNRLQLHRATVERYLDLLEKCFIIHRVGGFSRNLRKEVTKSARYYFVDTGIRNAVLDAFQPLALRDDTGSLWENYFINERIRQNEYERHGRTGFFWRTHDQQEIDWIEVDGEGFPTGFECKWSKRSWKPPLGWSRNYPDAPVHLIHRENVGNFI